MRSALVPLALLTALGLAALSPATALAQQYSNSMRPSFYTPRNYATPNASTYRPSNIGFSKPSYGMPNPYQYLPSFGSLNAGTPTPVGIVHTLPGTLVTGVNFGGPPAANLPLPADGSPISVNVAQPPAAMLNALTPAEQPAGTPTPENAAQVPAEALPTDATTQAAYGTLTQGTFVPNALTAPPAAPATATPYTAPSLSAPAYSRGASLAPAATYAPTYGTFAPAPRLPASFSSALNRVYGQGY